MSEPQQRHYVARGGNRACAHVLHRSTIHESIGVKVDYGSCKFCRQHGLGASGRYGLPPRVTFTKQPPSLVLPHVIDCAIRGRLSDVDARQVGGW
jgi:hypothetical protein